MSEIEKLQKKVKELQKVIRLKNRHAKKTYKYNEKLHADYGARGLGVMDELFLLRGKGEVL